MDKPVGGVAVVAEWFASYDALDGGEEPRVVSTRTSGPDGRVPFEGAGACRVRVDDPWYCTEFADYEAGVGSDVVELRVRTGGRVGGRVVDAEGRPVPGAVIHARGCSGSGAGPEWATRFSGWARVTRTDEWGRYVFPTVPGYDPTLAVRADHPGFAPSSIVGVPVRARELTEAPDLVLQIGVRLYFVVRGPEEEPVPGARLLLRDPQTPSCIAEVESEGETNDRGELFVDRWGLERVDVAVSASRYAPLRLDCIEASADPIQIRLERGHSIEGRVLSEAGLPLAGREVTAWPAASVESIEDPFESFSFEEATTDGDGRFRILDLPPASFRVWTEGARAVTVPAGATDLELVVDPPVGIVRGRVLDAHTGAPIRARLDTHAFSGGRLEPLFPPAEIRSDPAGFEIRNAPPGTYQIMAEAPGYTRAVSTVEIADDRPVEGLEILMEPQTVVEGTVRDSTTGKPVAGATVSLETDRRLAERDPLSTYTDADGTFSLPADPGSGVLRVTHPDYLESTGWIEVAYGMESLHVQLGRGACLEGRVTRAGTAVGEDEAHVRIVELSHQGAMTDGEGRYRVCGLPPGFFVVECTLMESEQAPFLQEIEVADGGTVRLDIELVVSGEIHGRIGTSERPIAFAEVTVERVGPEIEVARIRADRDGRYEVRGLVDGTYRVNATGWRDADLQSKSCEIRGGTWARVDLFAWEGEVLLEVVDETGNPTSAEEVELRGFAGEARGLDVALFSSSSRYRGGGLPLGTYQVWVKGFGGASALEELTLEGPMRLTVRLEQGPASARLRVTVRDPEGIATWGSFLLVPVRVDAAPIVQGAAHIPAGVYDLYVGAPGLAPRKLGRIELRAGEERTIEVRLEEGSTLWLDIGRPFPRGSRVVLRNEEGVDLAPVASLHGRPPVYHLPAGSYDVAVELPDGRRGERRADLGRGETMRLKLTLE